MKHGDLVRFTKEHYSQPGFAYCADWTGIVVAGVGDTYRIHWTTPRGMHKGDIWLNIAIPGVEVINESR